MLKLCCIVMICFTATVFAEDEAVELPEEILDCLRDFKDLYIRWRSFDEECRANTLRFEREDFHKYNDRIQKCLKDNKNADFDEMARRDECRQLATNTLTDEQGDTAQKIWEDSIKDI